MPPYWRFRRRQRYYRNFRRPRFSRRRARKPFQRKRWRKPKYFWNKVKRLKRFKKYKKKKITLKVFQPRTVNKCKIKGYKCLFQGSTLRLSKNYIQGIYAQTPEFYPFGGGWSLLVFSLDSLFEDYNHLENIWTKSNVALPLVRYTGCKMKLYQSLNCDYVFAYDNCWPLVDTIHKHADSSPSRMLQHRHKIIIPSTQTQKRKKPYKTVRIKPPPQMTNNWYFAHDLHKLPLLMTTTTSVSLTTPFNNQYRQSPNITLHCLNPLQIQNPNFQHFNNTTGWNPKWLPQGTISKPVYWYASLETHTSPTKKSFVEQLIFLGNTKENQEGKTLKEIASTTHFTENTKKNWGNPFFHRFIEKTEDKSYTIYFSFETVVDLVNKLKQSNSNDDTFKTVNFTEVTGPIIYDITYNAAKDAGFKNKIYFIKTIDQNNTNPTDNENIQLEGFPLPIMLWGWPDWLKKLKLASNPENDFLLVIETDMFDEKLDKYILIDYDFIEGRDPYQTQEGYSTNYYNKNNWFPNLRYQNQSIEKLCQCDVGCYKPNSNNYIEAYCRYTFYFKWGGCPKQLEKPYDPSLQPIWTTANNIISRPEIQDPSTRAETQLFSWDWAKDYISQTAIERIKQFTRLFEPLPITESKSDSTIQIPQAKTTEKEKKEKAEHLLQHLRKQQLLQQLKLFLQLKKSS
nr:MAG: ORF1 [TTV-like mini virus]